MQRQHRSAAGEARVEAELNEEKGGGTRRIPVTTGPGSCRVTALEGLTDGLVWDRRSRGRWTSTPATTPPTPRLAGEHEARPSRCRGPRADTTTALSVLHVCPPPPGPALAGPTPACYLSRPRSMCFGHAPTTASGSASTPPPPRPPPSSPSGMPQSRCWCRCPSPQVGRQAREAKG